MPIAENSSGISRSSVAIVPLDSLVMLAKSAIPCLYLPSGSSDSVAMAFFFSIASDDKASSTNIVCIISVGMVISYSRLSPEFDSHTRLEIGIRKKGSAAILSQRSWTTLSIASRVCWVSAWVAYANFPRLGFYGSFEVEPRDPGTTLVPWFYWLYLLEHQRPRVLVKSASQFFSSYLRRRHNEPISLYLSPDYGIQ